MRMRVVATLYLAVSSSGCMAAPGDGSAVGDDEVAAASQPATDGHAIKTVFMIVMENKNWWQIKGSSSAPYINQQLLPNASYAGDYNNPPNQHPSEGNYFWLEGGTSFGIGNDGDPAQNHQASTQHLA